MALLTVEKSNEFSFLLDWRIPAYLFFINGSDGKDNLLDYTEKGIDISSLQNEAYLIQIISLKEYCFILCTLPLALAGFN